MTFTGPICASGWFVFFLLGDLIGGLVGVLVAMDGVAWLVGGLPCFCVVGSWTVGS